MAWLHLVPSPPLLPPVKTDESCVHFLTVHLLLSAILLLLKPVCSARFQGSASVALVEASVCVKIGDLATADKVLTGLQTDSPITNLQAVLSRAQLAVNNKNLWRYDLLMCALVVFSGDVVHHL